MSIYRSKKTLSFIYHNKVLNKFHKPTANEYQGTLAISKRRLSAGAVFCFLFHGRKRKSLSKAPTEPTAKHNNK